MACVTVPALIGVALYAFRPAGVSVDTDPYLPFFSVIIAVWGVLFVVVSATHNPLNLKGNSKQCSSSFVCNIILSIFSGIDEGRCLWYLA